MKKQVFALVTSGLLLASGMTFAQTDTEEAAAPAAGTTGTNAGTEGAGNFGAGKIALTAAIVGGAIAAASDSGGGSGSTTTTTTNP